jgi:hypothetical protein
VRNWNGIKKRRDFAPSRNVSEVVHPIMAIPLQDLPIPADTILPGVEDSDEAEVETPEAEYDQDQRTNVIFVVLRSTSTRAVPQNSKY